MLRHERREWCQRVLRWIVSRVEKPDQRVVSHQVHLCDVARGRVRARGGYHRGFVDEVRLCGYCYVDGGDIFAGGGIGGGGGGGDRGERKCKLPPYIFRQQVHHDQTMLQRCRL